MTDYFTPDEARELLDQCERQLADLRAKHPDAAHVFPPISAKTWRPVMELALLGELRRLPLLPPLDVDDEADPSAHQIP
jgi:hypothetical protein